MVRIDPMVAGYLVVAGSKAEHPGPPGKVDAIPWDRVKFQQTASTGDGKKIGSQSARLDFDRWQGTREELRIFLGLPVDPPKPKGILTLTWPTIDELAIAIANAGSTKGDPVLRILK